MSARSVWEHSSAEKRWWARLLYTLLNRLGWRRLQEPLVLGGMTQEQFTDLARRTCEAYAAAMQSEAQPGLDRARGFLP